MPLTAKQAAFVNEYLIDLNATQAAIRAGYSEKTARFAGHENLTKPNIAAEIERAFQARAQRTEVTADRVLTEIAKLAFANLMDYFSVTNHGEPNIDLSALTPDQSAALTEIQVDSYTDGRGDGTREVKRIKIKMADKKGALELLARHLNLFNDIRSNDADNKSLDAFTTALSELAVKRNGSLN